MAGKFAPKTPMLDLTNTGKGIPCLTLGFPERFTNHIMKKPARINARNTAHPFNPDAKNNDAAKVYPNKLCTSFAQTLKISNQPQFFLLLAVGARSELYKRLSLFLTVLIRPPYLRI
jgi:hypothetical protein